MIAVIGAMEEEITPFQQMLQDVKELTIADVTFYQGTFNDQDVVLMLSGIGKVNAAVSTSLLLHHFKPELVLNIGTAGGVNEALNVGDIVLSEKVVHHDVDVTHFGYEYGQVPKLPTYFESDLKVLQLAQQLDGKINQKIHSGIIATGDSFIGRNDQITLIKSRFNDLLAVEMEAAAIAQVCNKFQVPFLVVRSISDVAGKESHISFKEYIDIAAQNATQLLTFLLEHIALKNEL